MQQLDRAGRHVRALAQRTELPGAEQGEHGPHLLALALDDVVHDAVQQRGAALHRIAEAALEVAQVLCDRLLDLLQAGHPVGKDGQRVCMPGNRTRPGPSCSRVGACGQPVPWYPMRPLRLSFLCLLLVTATSVFAQDKPKTGVVLYRDRLAQQFDTVKVVKNIFKLNPLLFFRGGSRSTTNGP